MPIKIKKRNGFTLLEVLISVVIMAFVSIGLVSMQSVFSKSIISRQVATALTDVANNQIAILRAKKNTPSNDITKITDYKIEVENNAGNVKERNLKIYTYLLQADGVTPFTGSWTYPSANTCNDLIIRVTDGKIYDSSNSLLGTTDLKNVLDKSKTVTLQTTICDFN